MALHDLLDWHYGPDAADQLRRLLTDGADVNEAAGPRAETPLHVAARRRRADACAILLEFGTDVNARTAGGKTAWAHAARRGFRDICQALEPHGADTALTTADRLAVALSAGDLDEVHAILAREPGAARTGNPEEDRVLADMAGRNDPEPVLLLLDAGADLGARALDGGTALHQAAWFGQPQNARLLLDAGAPLEDFGDDHESSPLGWAVHGSRCSGGADRRQDAYVAVTQMLLDAGARLAYPDDDSDRFYRRLLEDASPAVRAVLERQDGRAP